MNPSIGLKRRMSVWLMTVHAACENGVPLGGTPFFHVCHMPSGRVGTGAYASFCLVPMRASTTLIT